MKRIFFILISIFAFGVCGFTYAANPIRIIVLCGKSMHPYGAHENLLAGLLLKSSLEEALKDKVKVEITDALPGAESLAGVSLFVILGEGDKTHPLFGHENFLKTLYDAKVGVAMFHYATVFQNPSDDVLMRNCIGANFEKFYSVNPFWDAKINTASKHPAARGVRPFEIYDEWYFNLRFKPLNVTPLLEAIPPQSVFECPNGMYSNNKYARAQIGRPQVLAWVCENENKTRGFGFTGWHYIWNYNNDMFRKLIVNAVAWAAGFEVPQGGFETSRPSIEYIDSQITKPKPQGWDATLADWKSKAKLWNN